MQRILPDTNVPIDWLNEGRYGELLLAKGVLKHLSSVVPLELEAGRTSEQGAERAAQRRGRGETARAGVVLNG